MRLIDTHCHLNDMDAFPDPEGTLREALEAGVGRLVAVGVDVASSRRAVELAQEHPGVVYAVVGCHPNYAHEYQDSDLNFYESLLREEGVVGLGEIGLDYHWDFATREQQERALRAQWELALSMKVATIYHCREAWDDLLSLMEREFDPAHGVLFHCFSGDVSQAERAFAMGGYVGVDGPITYRKNDELRAMVAGWPRDRVVLETDAPWLPPHPHRGQPNRPALLPIVAATVAACWGVSVDEVGEITSANADRFFRLDLS